MKNIIKTIKAIIVVALGVLSFGSVAFADYSATVPLTTSGNFTVPAGVTSITVGVTGAGGGGAGGAYMYAGGGGGSGSSVSGVVIPVTPGQVIPFTIGTGGAAGTAGSASVVAGNGGNGSATYFGSYVTANGGFGGIGAARLIGNGVGGATGGIGGTNGADGRMNYGGNGGTNSVGTAGQGSTGNNSTYTYPTSGTNGTGGGAGSGWLLVNGKLGDAGANGGNGLIVVSYTADLTAPVITIAPYILTPTNQNITVNASTNEGTLNATSHTFTANGSFTFVATDAAGNVSSRTVTITNIDKVAPIITILPYATSSTNQNVVVSATTNEGTLNATSHTFTDNGSFTFIATDAAGNVSSTTVTITNIDKVAPIITIAPYILTPTNQDITVNASTNEGVLNATSTIFTANGSFTFIATDIAGNVSSTTVTITNIDKVAPVVTVLGTNPTLVEVNTTYIDAGIDAQDVSLPVTVLSTSTVNTSILGSYTVDYSVTDLAGNTATATRIVNVVDTTGPIITAPATQTFEATGTTTYPVLIPATAIDNSSSSPIITYNPAGFGLGTSTVVWTATDSSANIATTTSLVVIKDTTAPEMSLNGSSTVVLYVGDVYTELGASSTDLVNGIRPVTISGSVNTAIIGTYVITYISSDLSGNFATLTRTVNVVVAPDVTAPVITAPATQVFEATGTTTTPTLVPATATDDSGATPVITYAPTSFGLGTSTVVWTATDGSGNVATTTSLVVIQDTTAPVITLNGSSTINIFVGGTYTELGASSTDLVDGTILVTATGTVDTAIAGTYTIVYSASDLSGNTATTSRNVIVSVVPDTTAPVITAPATQVFEATGLITTPTLVSATATDNVTLNPTITYAPASFGLGTSTVVWTATDAAGNFATTTSLVVMQDTTAPVITLNGSSTIIVYIGGTYTELGASSTDLVNGVRPVMTLGSVNTSVVGTYVITYISSDLSGNVATANRTVIVSTLPPVLTSISIAPLNPSITVGSTTTFTSTTQDQYGNPFATTTTWISSNPSVGTINASGLFTAVSAGTTTITGTAGTLSTSTVVTVSNVVIPDTIPPVITLNGSSTINIFVGDVYTELGATAIDAVDGVRPVTATGTVDTAIAGTYTIVYSASDLSGNTATTSRNVIVSSAPAALASITISPLNPSLTVGSTTNFVASTTDQYGNPFATTTTWISSNPSVGTINASGLFTAVSAGTTTVTGTAGAFSASTTVTVSNVVIPPVLTSITISPLNPSLMVGSTTNFVASTTDQYGNPFAVSVIWVSSNNTVGTIDPFTGAFNALSNGTTTVTAFAGALSTSTVVTVSTIPPVLTSISIAPLNPSITVGSTTTFTSTTQDQYGNPFATTTTWTTSSSSVGTINAAGLFTAVSAGTTTITGTAGTLSTSTVVTVSNVVIPDVTAPTTPVITSGSATGTIIMPATVSWNNSTDAQSGLSGYLYVFDNNSSTVVSTTTAGVATTSATTTTSSNPGTVWFHVAAIDNAGNISGTASYGPLVLSDSAVLYTNSTIGGTFYNLFSPTLAQSVVASTTGTTTITNSTLSTFWNVNNSTLTNISINDVNLDAVVSSNSTFINADVANCAVINSLVKNYYARNCYVAFSTIDPSSGLNMFINSTSTNSQIYASDIYDSIISDYSYIATSTVSSSTISQSTVLDSVVATSTISNGSTIDNSNVSLSTINNSQISSSTIASSTLTNVVAASSSITNTVLSNATTTNAVIDSGTIYSGTITIGGVTYVITVPTLISSLGSTDTVAPVITILGSNPENVIVGNSYTDAGATAFDAFDATSTLVSATGTVDTSIVGTYTITYTSTDATGNSASSTRTVNVNPVAVPDTTAPVITVLGSNPVTVVAGTAYTDAGATALDNIDGNLTGLIITINPINLSTPVGVYTVTYTVSDAALNNATATRTVNVVAIPDVIAPVITILGSNPVNLTVGSTYTDAGATATDDVDGDITSHIVTTGLPINTSATGTQYVVYKVIDGAGNTASVMRTVNIIATPVDTVAPVITITGGTPITVSLGSVYSDQGATAMDAVDGTTTVTILSNDVNTSATGTYAVVYSATDAAGNNATATRQVNVIAAPADNIPPVITITGGTPITIYASSTYTELGATAIDNIDGPVAVSATGTVDVNTIGVYSITYSATDAASNTATAIRTVNVVEATSTDNIPPVITLINGTPITITVGSTYTDQGATAVDNIDGPVAVVTTGTVDTSIVGTYTITYTATDTAGNIATADRTVNVIAAPADNIPPVITITGGTPVTVLASSTYTDQGATAFDNVDGTTTVITASNDVNTNIIGSYSVVYTSTDLVGNMSSATRTVNVIIQDTIAPTITILGSNPMDVIRTLPYVEAGAVAIDNIDGSTTVAISGSVNTSATGTYAVVYTATDSSGNSASSTRTVNVIEDNIAPVITITGSNPFNLTVGGTYTDQGATAVDNIDGTVTATTTSNNVNTTVVGTYAVVYSATDAAGNSTSSTRIVNVNAADTIAPVITIVGSNPITVLVGASYTDAGATALDNIDGVRPVTSTSTVNTSAAGAYTVTYTSSDTLGNTATATRTVNVVATPDVTAPVITILGSNPVSVTVGGTYTDAGATATDNVDGNITSNITTINTVNAGVIGSYFVRYTVTDGAGNTASSTRNVNVVAAPVIPPVNNGGGNGGGPEVVPVTVPVVTTTPTTTPSSDTVAPVITVVGSNPTSITIGTAYVDAGATAYDNVDGNISPANISVINSVNTSFAGSYPVVYTVRDNAGNVGSATRTVVVNPVSSTATTTTGNTGNEVNSGTETTGTGIQIPSGVGELNPIQGGEVSTTTSTSSEATTTASKNNGLFAAVAEGFSNIPNKPIISLILLAIVFTVGLIFYRRNNKNTPNTPNTPNNLPTGNTPENL